MARQTDEGPAAANPVAVNSDNSFIDKMHESTLATPPTPDPTMTGRARFEQVLHSAPGEMGGSTWDTWLLSLPEDPNDVEYTRALRAAKNFAELRQNERGQKNGGVPAVDEPAPASLKDGGPQTASDLWRARLRALGINLPEPTSDEGKAGDSSSATALLSTESGGGPAGSLPFAWPPAADAKTGTANDNAARQQARVNKELDLRDEGEQQRKYREKLADKPIIMGLQVNDQAALVGETDPNNPSGTPDGYVSDWARRQGLALDDEHAQRAARNGNWVYQGEVADPAGGPGYTRSVYVYVDDAEAQLAGMPDATIKAYQRKLGNPESGVVDPELQSLWHAAVGTAQNYARAGKKVSLDFIFQQLINAKAKSGGGGGGGGGAAGPGATELAGSDYYQAMMQVLGDISGVKA